MANGKWKQILTEVGISDAGRRAIGWLTAGIGIYSGYALFLMVWEQQQQQKTVLEFLAALGAAAALSFAFEFLRSIIEGGNTQWSFPRVLATIVMLAAFELFIIATESAVGLGGSVAVGVAGFIFGEQFAVPKEPILDLLALGGLWLFVALMMIGKLRKFIEGWPYPNSSEQPGKPLGKYLADMGPDLLRGAWAGVLAGAIWGAAASVFYVFLFRAFFLAQWIHSNYSAWLDSLAAGGTFHLQGFPFLVAYGPMLFAGWCAKLLGGVGLLVGIAVATAVARGVVSESDKGLATLWPAATMLLVLGSPILADRAARHDLMALAYLSAVIWGIPGLVLGLLAPLLRGAAHHPPVWGVVATGAAVVLLVVTLARFQAPDAAAAEKLLLLGATALAVFLALQLFRGRWSEEFWLFVALSVGLIVFGTTRAAQESNLLAMQQNAYQLIQVTLGVPPTVTPDDALAPLLNFGQNEGYYLGRGGMAALLPLGENSLLFLHDPCAGVREFTPEQRASFASSLQTEAAQNMKAANAALTEFNTGTQNFPNFQQGWATAVSTAGSDPKPGTPEMQISELRARLTTLEGWDGTRKDWAKWAATKPPQRSLLQYEEPATVCQSDLDNLLADLNRTDQDQQTAQANLAMLRQRVAGELPPEDEMADAEAKAAQLREGLQTEQAQRLELAMTTSLGFWLTIGLLAMWRLTQPDTE